MCNATRDVLTINMTVQRDRLILAVWNMHTTVYVLIRLSANMPVFLWEQQQQYMAPLMGSGKLSFLPNSAHKYVKIYVRMSQYVLTRAVA